MQISSLPDPIWVNTPEKLNHLVNDLTHQARLAIDTESNSLYVYQEYVCLIQFSTPTTDYLLDPLDLKDLSRLADIFANPQIEKIFHACEYDIICLRRDYHFSFANIFDTMHAARILGRSGVGLGSLLEEEFGLQINKRYQRANWGIRPLSPEMLNYARLDTHYLLPLRDILADALQTANRWQLAQEDFERLCHPAVPASENGNQRPLNSRELNARQNTVLHELCHYRDQQARRLDLPPFKVLSNEMLIEIAQQCPKTIAELENLRSVPPRLRQRHGEQLLHSVQRGLAAPLLSRSTPARPDEAYLWRMETLREWRKQTAQKMGVESDIILPRETMEAIAESNPKTLEELSNVLNKLPWRLQHYGQDILKQLHPKE